MQATTLALGQRVAPPTKTYIPDIHSAPWQWETNNGLLQTKPKVLEALSNLYPLNKVGHVFTVTAYMNVMFSLTENVDIELYNRYVKKRLMDHYADKARFCPSNRVVEKRDLW